MAKVRAVNALAVAIELSLIVLTPLVCRARGHRPHAWPLHAASPLKICDRCWHTFR